MTVSSLEASVTMKGLTILYDSLDRARLVFLDDPACAEGSV